MIQRDQCGELILTDPMYRFLLQYYRDKVNHNNDIADSLIAAQNIIHSEAWHESNNILFSNGYTFYIDSDIQEMNVPINSISMFMQLYHSISPYYQDYKSFLSNRNTIRTASVIIYDINRNIYLSEFPVDLLQNVIIRDSTDNMSLINCIELLNSYCRETGLPSSSNFRREIGEANILYQRIVNNTSLPRRITIQDILNTVEHKEFIDDTIKEQYIPVTIKSNKYTGYGIKLNKKNSDNTYNILVRERGKFRFIKESAYNSAYSNQALSEFCTVKIKSANKSSELFGAKKFKSDMVGEEYSILEYIDNYECRKDGKLRTVVEVSNGKTNTKFLLEELEIIYPKVLKGYNHPKDRSIKKKDQVILTNNKGINLEKGEILRVITSTSNYNKCGHNTFKVKDKNNKTFLISANKVKKYENTESKTSKETGIQNPSTFKTSKPCSDKKQTWQEEF